MRKQDGDKTARSAEAFWSGLPCANHLRDHGPHVDRIESRSKSLGVRIAVETATLVLEEGKKGSARIIVGRRNRSLSIALKFADLIYFGTKTPALMDACQVL